MLIFCFSFQPFFVGTHSLRYALEHKVKKNRLLTNLVTATRAKLPLNFEKMQTEKIVYLVKLPNCCLFFFGASLMPNFK
jgi:hypothetical protein